MQWALVDAGSPTQTIIDSPTSFGVDTWCWCHSAHPRSPTCISFPKVAIIRMVPNNNNNAGQQKGRVETIGNGALFQSDPFKRVQQLLGEHVCLCPRHSAQTGEHGLELCSNERHFKRTGHQSVPNGTKKEHSTHTISPDFYCLIILPTKQWVRLRCAYVLSSSISPHHFSNSFDNCEWLRWMSFVERFYTLSANGHLMRTKQSKMIVRVLESKESVYGFGWNASVWRRIEWKSPSAAEKLYVEAKLKCFISLQTVAVFQ